MNVKHALSGVHYGWIYLCLISWLCWKYLVFLTVYALPMPSNFIMTTPQRFQYMVVAEFPIHLLSSPNRGLYIQDCWFHWLTFIRQLSIHILMFWLHFLPLSYCNAFIACQSEMIACAICFLFHCRFVRLSLIWLHYEVISNDAGVAFAHKTRAILCIRLLEYMNHRLLLFKVRILCVNVFNRWHIVCFEPQELQKEKQLILQ